jgi:peptidoglycan/LPS O-acetylase OafA/YrhL
MRIQETDLARSSNNFDAIRLIAACFVLIGHSSAALLNRPLAWDPAVELFGIGIHYFGVLIFFIISGFLVTRSWEARKNIADFLMARALRIFPALTCVVLLSVFVLGLMFTTWSRSDYLSSATTHKYLEDMSLYRMYYYLPGVFETNPNGGSVNASLWTLPYEFTCYLFLMILGMMRILKNKYGPLLLLTTSALSYFLFKEKIDTVVIPVLGIDFKNFFSLFLYFLSGSVFYKFREQVPFNWIGLLMCVIGTILIKMNYAPELLFVVILPYLVFLFAFSGKVKLHQAGRYGDLSYGIFLYAFPVQQLIVHFLAGKIEIWQMIVLSLIGTVPFAVLSWKFIERPALQFRQKLAIKSTNWLK